MSSLLNGRVRTHATRLSSACVEALVLAVRSARSRTVVILPGGMMEEYGPYLPSFTDGYINDTGELPNPHPLTEVERKEEGLSIHAGAFETSSILFLRPDLVGPIGQATPLPGASFKDIVEQAKRPDWPGYFGSPRLATAARALTRSAKSSSRRITPWRSSTAPTSVRRSAPGRGPSTTSSAPPSPMRPSLNAGSRPG